MRNASLNKRGGGRGNASSGVNGSDKQNSNNKVNDNHYQYH